jgi:lysophospholipase L1-like esterase
LAIIAPPFNAVAADFKTTLKRLAARAAQNNPLTLGTASGVTVTAPASADATLTTSVAAVSAGALTANAANFAFHGGTATPFPAQSWVLFPVSSVAPSTAGNLSGYLTTTPSLAAWTWEAEWMTDAPLMEVVFLATAATNVRVLVDGQYATAAPIVPNAYSGSQIIRLDFSSVRKGRRIQFRSRGAVGFQGVKVTTKDAVWQPDQADVLKIAVTGDSFGEGQGIASPYDPDAAYPLQLGHLLGWADIRQVAVGSTGYVTTASGVRSKVRDQIPNWGFVPDVIVCAAGYNDQGTGVTTAATATEAALAWAAMRAIAPKAPLFIIGPWIGRRTATNMLPYETALLAAFTAWGGSNAYFVKVSGDPSPWTTGTGYVGATTGTGNGDFYMASDAVHPTDAGHAYHARRMASAIRGIIGTL